MNQHQPESLHLRILSEENFRFHSSQHVSCDEARPPSIVSILTTHPLAPDLVGTVVASATGGNTVAGRSFDSSRPARVPRHGARRRVRPSVEHANSFAPTGGFLAGGGEGGEKSRLFIFRSMLMCCRCVLLEACVNDSWPCHSLARCYITAGLLERRLCGMFTHRPRRTMYSPFFTRWSPQIPDPRAHAREAGARVARERASRQGAGRERRRGRCRCR